MQNRADFKLPASIDLASGNFAPVNQDIKSRPQQPENPRGACCCCQIDKYAAVFLAQVLVSVFVLAFSAYQLSRGGENNNNAFYMSNIALVLGLWTNLNPLGGGGIAVNKPPAKT